MKERVQIVQDTAKIEELENRIKNLMVSFEELNKTISFKEAENKNLFTKLLEIDHLKRTKSHISEEN